MKIISQLAFYIAVSFALIACGGGSSSSVNFAEDPNNSITYSTTSTRGDYSEWSLDGNDLEASWQVISETGAVDYTFDFDASCADADAFGVSTCTFDTVTCSAGAETCPTALPSGDFSVVAVPGVALFAQTSTGGDQLHVGFVKDAGACSARVDGDYSYMHLGLGQRDIFGLYQSDIDFLSIRHADFGFETTNMNMTQTLSYNTGVESEALINNGCSDGVRRRTLPGGDAIRSMITSSGLFVLDLPAGQGGILAFDTSNAALIGDFANTSFTGISFPDNTSPQFFRASSGALSSSGVEVTVDFRSSSPAVEIYSMQALGGFASLTMPAYPDFNDSPAGYSASNIADDYDAPADFPGFFKFDDLTDEGRVIFAAAELNSKVVAFGAVYNYRNTSDTNPNTGEEFDEPGLYNTGSFIMFEQ